MAHVEKFLLELGVGFALVGRQMHMELGDQDFYLDLLFYHLKLRCFVVIDLKNRVIAESALRDVSKPIGISGYVTKLVESLPKSLKGSVPSVAELERGLAQT